jgi:hypothetical protein
MTESITPEQAAHELRDAVVDIPSRVMTDPATYKQGSELGFEGMDFYTAGRGGALGDVPADVVTASFVFFEPNAVRTSWERSAAVMTRRRAAETWAAGFHQRAIETFPEDRDWKMVTDLLARVLDATSVAGVPLFAGWRSLPEPDDLRARAMHQLNAMRELRGGLHGAAILTVGLLPIEAIAVRSPAMLSVFGWPKDRIETEPLHQRWSLAEARTDRMFGRHLAVLTDAERAALVETLGTLPS